jgi:hypothetical protein
MHNEAQIILQQVFNKRSLNDVSISELKELTEQYPYFNAAQFLLAKKIRLEKGEAEASISRDLEAHSDIVSNPHSAKHPALFFHNPLWFNFLMKQEFKSNEIGVEDELVLDSKHLAEESEISEESGVPSEIGVQDKSGVSSETGVSDIIEVPVETDEAKENDVTENPEPGHPFLNEAQSELEITASEVVIDEGQNFDNSEDEIVKEPVEQNQKISESLKQSSIEQKKPTDESLEFEPFHTIDYFASQGIKLQQAELGKDKFGQQLRSFTEWLKSMKKIPPPSPDDTGDPVVQEQVIQFAQVSNETKEIITETMAEVWSLQGNRQKAIEIYKKLSLLNPAKSAYFASKIDKLNS